MKAFIKHLIRRILDEDCLGMSAEMAFHFTLTFFPTIIAGVSLLGIMGQWQGIPQQLVNLFYTIFPPPTAEFLLQTVRELVQDSSANLALAGFGLALWTASGGAYISMKALNRIFGSEWTSFWQRRLFAVGLVFAFIIFVLVVSNFLLFGNVVVDFLQQHPEVQRIFPLKKLGFVSGYHWVIFILAVLGFSTMIYRLFPSARSIYLSHAFLGSVVFVGLWLSISHLFTFYVMNIANISRFYGTMGGFMFFMIWLYLSSLAFLVGGIVSDWFSRQNRISKG